jgi:tetratricopeptide (TPR) repeat protein
MLGDFAEAQAIIDSVDTPDGKPFSYTGLAKAVYKHGNREAARKLFQIALDLAQALPGKFDNNLDKGLALQVIGQGMAVSGEIDGAVKLSETLGTTEYRPLILITVALEQARAGNKDLSNKTFTEAKRFADKLDGLFRESALAEIAEAQTQASELSQANQTTSKIAVVPEIGQSAVARVLADKGDVINLRKLAATARDVAGHADILASLAKALYRTGDKAAAMTAVRESFAAAAHIDNPAMRMSILCSIAEAQESGGDQEAAKTTLLRAIRAAKEDPSELTLGHEFGRIAVLQALLGDTDAAFKTLGGMAGLFAIPAYQEVATAYTRKSGVQAAFHCLDSIDKSEHKVRWVLGMAEGLTVAK